MLASFLWNDDAFELMSQVGVFSLGGVLGGALLGAHYAAGPGLRHSFWWNDDAFELRSQVGLAGCLGWVCCWLWMMLAASLSTPLYVPDALRPVPFYPGR